MCSYGSTNPGNFLDRLWHRRCAISRGLHFDSRCREVHRLSKDCLITAISSHEGAQCSTVTLRLAAYLKSYDPHQQEATTSPMVDCQRGHQEDFPSVRRSALLHPAPWQECIVTCAAGYITLNSSFSSTDLLPTSTWLMICGH